LADDNSTLGRERREEGGDWRKGGGRVKGGGWRKGEGKVRCIHVLNKLCY